MDAIQYLTDQHHEVESLFDQIESAARATTKRRLCRKLVDLLAVHAAVEEMIFYPAAQDAGVEEPLLGGLEDHVASERLAAVLVRAGGVGREAAAAMARLRSRKSRHADAEERELFPRAKELLPPERLEALGRCMENVAETLLAPGVGARERIAARRVLA